MSKLYKHASIIIMRAMKYMWKFCFNVSEGSNTIEQLIILHVQSSMEEHFVIKIDIDVVVCIKIDHFTILKYLKKYDVKIKKN